MNKSYKVASIAHLILLSCLFMLSGTLKGQSLTKIFTDDLYYAPVAYACPMFTQTNQVKVSAHLISSYGINAALATSPHLGLMTGFNFTPREESHAINWYVGAILFGKLIPEKNWIYEAGVTAGFGKAKVVRSEYNVSEKLSNYQVSFQGTIGYSSTNLEYAFIPRISYFEFYNWQADQQESHPWLYGYWLEGMGGTIIEPGFMVRGGSQNFKVGGQISVPLLINDTDFGQLNMYDHLVFLLTFSYSFALEK